MISAETLYRKIKAMYPNFQITESKSVFQDLKELEKRGPVLTQRQLELLENGFPVEPNFNPFFYKQSEGRMDDIIDNLIYGMEIKNEE